MQPHLGAGAGQGLEDAYLLGRLLAHAQTSRANVSVRRFVYAFRAISLTGWNRTC